jgi:hypothetical protein
MPDLSKLSPGQRAYEEKRAKKAGMTLEKYLAAKEREAAEAARAEARAAEEAAKKAKPKGFFRRLLDQAHKPL